MVYCTYVQFGILKRAVLSEATYNKYERDSSITNLQSYATQSSMDESYARQKGGSVSSRTILHG